MKFPFVTRKKYEILKENNRIINDERLRLVKDNNAKQNEIKKLREENALMQEQLETFKTEKIEKVSKTRKKKTKKEV